MSGGHFDYNQHRITYIADEIQKLIDLNESKEIDYFGYEKGRHYSSDTIARFIDAVSILRKAAIYTQRIDWLLCDDDGEEAFHKRLDEELRGEDRQDGDNGKR